MVAILFGSTKFVALSSDKTGHFVEPADAALKQVGLGVRQTSMSICSLTLLLTITVAVTIGIGDFLNWNEGIQSLYSIPVIGK